MVTVPEDYVADSIRSKDVWAEVRVKHLLAFVPALDQLLTAFKGGALGNDETVNEHICGGDF